MKVGFIGAGNMGGALARAISEEKQINIYIYDIHSEKSEGLAREIGAAACELDNLLAVSDFVFLGVKPNKIFDVCNAIKDKIKPNAVMISMAAGVTLAQLGKALGGAIPVIRMMPNTPVTYGAGMTAWCKNQHVTEDMAQNFIKMMMLTGAIDEIPEEKIDAFCAIAGCGPAYAYMFINALTEAGEKCGLDRNQALFYASEMLRGSALMAEKSSLSPKILCQNVCSPGGSTIEGVKVLETEGFEDAVFKAIVAAFHRTKELGKQS